MDQMLIWISASRRVQSVQRSPVVSRPFALAVSWSPAFVCTVPHSYSTEYTLDSAFFSAGRRPWLLCGFVASPTLTSPLPPFEGNFAFSFTELQPCSKWRHVVLIALSGMRLLILWHPFSAARHSATWTLLSLVSPFWSQVRGKLSGLLDTMAPMKCRWPIPNQ